jgi:Flp pilus assembly protein TadB
MENLGLIIFGVLLAVGAGVVVYLNYNRKRNLNKLFEQVAEALKTIPKQKKNNFLLFMFKDSMSASKKKTKTTSALEKNMSPKQLEIQMIQMATILKDRSKVTDKKTKNALKLLDDYLAWEKNKK